MHSATAHKTSLGEATQGISLRFNTPQFFEREDFVQWLKTEKAVATWDDRSGSTVHEFSDVFLVIDGSLNGEGSDNCGLMPEDIWDSVVAACREALGDHTFDENITVRLTNLR